VEQLKEVYGKVAGKATVGLDDFVAVCTGRGVVETSIRLTLNLLNLLCVHVCAITLKVRVSSGLCRVLVLNDPHTSQTRWVIENKHLARNGFSASV
jgi:hypothetical protein